MYTVKKPQNLFVLSGEQEDEDPYQWNGMPEFEQEYKKPYDEITFFFESQEDLDYFANLVDLPKVANKGIIKGASWYPDRDRFRNSGIYWYDEDDIESLNIELVDIDTIK